MPDAGHEFLPEVQTCRQMFRNDSTSYLKKIDKLYRDDLREVRSRYNAIFKDNSVNCCDKQELLHSVGKELELTAKLQTVIQELLFDRMKLSGKCVKSFNGLSACVNDNYKTLVLQKAISIIKKKNPCMSEEEAVQRFKDIFAQMM
jgi:hypothetical protein